MRKILFGLTALTLVAVGSLTPAKAQMSGGVTMDNHYGGGYGHGGGYGRGYGHGGGHYGGGYGNGYQQYSSS
jgi:hypothetical protein